MLVGFTHPTTFSTMRRYKAMNQRDDIPGRPASDRETFRSLPLLSRRAIFSRIGGGFGAPGLAQMLEGAGIQVAGESARAAPPGGKEEAVPHDPLAPRPSHFPARAK